MRQVGDFGRINISLGEANERMMMTGLHRVCDIFCLQCYNCIGWKYVSQLGVILQLFAFEQSQKYKEGKFIIERANIKKFRRDDLPPQSPASAAAAPLL